MCRPYQLHRALVIIDRRQGYVELHRELERPILGRDEHDLGIDRDGADLAARLGEAAQAKTRKEFLPDRAARDWLSVMEAALGN